MSRKVLSSCLVLGAAFDMGWWFSARDAVVAVAAAAAPLAVLDVAKLRRDCRIHREQVHASRPSLFILKCNRSCKQM